MKKMLLVAAMAAAWAGAGAATPAFLHLNDTGKGAPAPQGQAVRSQQTDQQGRRARGAAQDDAENLLHIGYLGDQAYVYCYDGLAADADVDFQAATRLKPELLAPFVGTKIVKLRFGWSNPDHTGSAHWTIRASRDGEPIDQGDATFSFSWSDPWDTAGWNTVELAEPVEITAETPELWIGYTVNLHADEYSIPVLTYGTYEPESQYVQRLDDPGWQDISNDYGPMYMEALVLDERTDVAPSLKLVRLTTLPIQTVGQPSKGDLWVKNDGTRAINSITFTYTLGEQTESITGDVGDLKPGSSTQLEAPILALGTGTHTLKVTALNGTEVETPQQLSYEMVGVPADVAAQYVKKGIVEFFVSEAEHNSPRYYEEMVVPGLEGFEDDFILVNQHCNDRFMVRDDATQLLLDFYDNDSSKVYLPAIAIDRSWIPGTGDWMFPDCPVQYTFYPYFAPLYYNIARETPAFGSVEITPALDGRDFTVNVSGNVAAGVLPQGEHLNLTVYLMENGVVSTTQEMPDDPDWVENHPYTGTYTHDHVIRLQPTPLYGEPLDASGSYAKTYTGTLPDDCAPDNMYVVAMLNRGVDNGVFDRNIVNAAQADFATTGIVRPAADASEALLTVVGGSVVSSDGQAVEVYDLSGRRVANASLPAGLYIARTAARAAKVAVK